MIDRQIKREREREGVRNEERESEREGGEMKREREREKLNRINIVGMIIYLRKYDWNLIQQKKP